MKFSDISIAGLLGAVKNDVTLPKALSTIVNSGTGQPDAAHPVIQMDATYKSVLVVESDAGIANMIRAILNAGMVNAIYSQSGFDALSKIKTESLSMVICDTHLPDMSGYDILQDLRQTEATKDLPFAFLSSYTADEDIAKGLAAGANKYMAKPFTARQMLDTVREFVAR